MAITGVSIVSIPVKDQAAAKTFYTEKVGFQLLADNPFQGEVNWIEVGPQGVSTRFTLVTWFPQMPPGSLQGVVLETDNIEADHAALKARGLEINDIEIAPWGTSATFYDPDGNGWVLQQSR